MAPTHKLSAVRAHALTICKRGANGQSIFLRKADGPTLTLPAVTHRLVKAAEDWSTAYCVVASPDAEEAGGIGAEEVIDTWESDTEIAKAAHAFLRDRAFVNKAHDEMEAEGCHIVENAVALADFGVGDTTIKKGSWYVGVELDEDARAAVEAGDITGVSIEGTGTRTEIEKAKADPKAQGSKGKDRDSGPTHRTCPKCDGKVKLGVKTCPNCSTALKKTATFDEVVGEREFSDNLWRAWSTFEGVVFDAFRDEDEDDPHGVIRASIDQFRDHLLSKLDASTATERKALAKELGTLSGTTDEEDEMGLTEDFAALKKNTDETLASLKKEGDATTVAVEGLVGLTGKLVDRVEALAGSGDGEDGKGAGKKVKKEATSIDEVVAQVGKLADSVDTIDSELTGIAKSIEKLGEGDSSQDEPAATVRKSKHPLDGLLA